MHSLVPALLITALSAFASAAPVGLPNGLPNPGPVLASPPVLKAEAIVSDAGAALASLGARTATTPSVVSIFQNLLDQITPDTDQMTLFSPSSASVPEITDTAESIERSMVAAGSALRALTGATAQSEELDVDQAALVAAKPVARILSAMQNAVDVTKSNGSVDQVRASLADLGKQTTALIVVSVQLVPGLDVALGVALKPMQPIIVKLYTEIGLVL